MAARMTTASQNRRMQVFIPDDIRYKVWDWTNSNTTVDDCDNAAAHRRSAKCRNPQKNP